MKPASPPLLSVALLLAVLSAGCSSPPTKPPAPSATFEPSSVHVYVTRPLKLIPEPSRFVDGALGCLRERLVLSGYDSSGVSAAENQAFVLQDLPARNARVPGSAGIHLTFVEAPLGFALIFASVRCAVYGPDGTLLLAGKLDPPKRRSLAELILPPRHPDVDGRRWMGKVYERVISLALPPRKLP